MDVDGELSEDDGLDEGDGPSVVQAPRQVAQDVKPLGFLGLWHFVHKINIP